jgi:transcription elongation factor Elf1
VLRCPLCVELGSESDARARKRKAASKTRYTCPTCGANAWAKQQTSVVCGDCEVAMEADAEA